MTPYEQARADFEQADRANLALFLALDNAVSFGHMERLSTSVLNALDYARVCAAKLSMYLVEPAVKQVESGPMQDQGPKEAYQNGFLSIAEYDQLTRENADNAAPVASVQLLPDGSMIFCDPRMPS